MPADGTQWTVILFLNSSAVESPQSAHAYFTPFPPNSMTFCHPKAEFKTPHRLHQPENKTPLCLQLSVTTLQLGEMTQSAGCKNHQR